MCIALPSLHKISNYKLAIVGSVKLVAIMKVIRLYFEFFIFVLIPFTVISGILGWLETFCDPKLGCMGTFVLILAITAMCASLSAAGVLAGHLRSKSLSIYQNFRWFFLALGVIISLLTVAAFLLSSSIGIPITVIIWFVVPYLATTSFYKLKAE